ncbi:MAG: 30S ribosomal protein S3 [Tissierellia bacterium]|jgi:small subunit ribosomal protein S3|nr:30S ribosomal protein S3 [Tissierellia bacterium]MDD3226415.1 30S ribosomal protein S3 [Tissierellia bacterium]MDD3750590.1 30S ribosomal protein S3 [Tissierellia bacterium]MDD4046216.1 30S ribosomal protein S3 [Tissierellia bacterium]MDD4436982.1 30S ribosomal protein S3 [Tissierellia bacterium]
MGQKVNPHGLRVGIINDWDSKWYADKKNFGDNLTEDYKIREYIKKENFQAGIAKIEIERFAGRVKVSVFTAKPGMIIGKGGTGVDNLKTSIEKITGKTVIINVEEVKVPELNGQLVAENIASQIEKRISFRRAMKQAMQRTMKTGAKGIKTSASGRLNGADMARTEGYSDGKVPLHTLRSDISYGFAEANTTFGKIGVKVWICRGEILRKPGSLLSDYQEPTRALNDNRDNKKKRRSNYRRDKKQ